MAIEHEGDDERSDDDEVERALAGLVEQPVRLYGHEEALRRIEIATRSRASKLDLSNLRLERLPPELWALTELSELTLSGNFLSTIPQEIGRLVQLETLSLSRCRLRDVPAELAHLTSLKYLLLSSNNLHMIPTLVTELPELRYLDFAANGLSSLPTEIARCTKLHKLDLSYNPLSRLPKELAQLRSLNDLALNNTRLTDLPEELADLPSLKTVWLSRCRLAHFPILLTRLLTISYLTLDYNQLTMLPREIGALRKLRGLFLSGNRLATLPKEVGLLTELRHLQLEGNQLTSLPSELRNLRNLKGLFLHENPRLGLPPEILGPTFLVVARNVSPASPAEILAYYFARLSGARRKLNEAKLLVVGEGEVGKSSLIERLLHDTFTPGKGKTEGIARETWRVPRANGGEPVRVNVWDFGGQEIMHATHQFFLTRRSLYLLVLAGRGGEHQGRLDYWLRAIQSYGGTSPIVIVANKGDEHELEINVNGLRVEYAPNVLEFFQVSSQSGAGVKELRQRLAELIGALDNVNDEVPERFFRVKTELERAAAAKNYLERAEYVELCRTHELGDRTEQDLLIRFLHELGTVLSFDDPESPYRLGDTHILNPEWVTEAVYAVINNNTLMQAGGVLALRDLGRIVRDEQRYPESKRAFIAELMRKFELCVDVPGRPGVLLVPGLLSVNQPALDWDESGALNFEYRYKVLPSGLMARFIVRMLGAVAAKTYWRTGVVLELEGCRALVRGDGAKNRVRISITGPQAARRRALAAIRAQFREIHATVAGFEPSEHVPLPGRPEVAVEYEHLLLLEERGTSELIPQGAKEPHSVEALLNGIEPPSARLELRELRREQASIEERRKDRLEPRHHSEPVPASNSRPHFAALALVFLIVVVALVGALTIAHERLGGGPAFILVVAASAPFVVIVLLFTAVFAGVLKGTRFERMINVTLDRLSLRKITPQAERAKRD